MWRCFLLSVLLSGASRQSVAHESNSFDSSWVKVNLGFLLRSHSMFRGSVVWPEPSVLLGPSLIFWDRLYVLGPWLRYHVFPDRQSRWDLRVSLRRFDDDKPWIRFGDHKVDHRNERPVSYDASASLQYKFGSKNKFFVGASVHQDVASCHGFYAEGNVGIPVVPFTSLLLDVGVSSHAAAQYTYGVGARSGASLARGTLQVFLPFVPGGGIFIGRLSFDSVLQEANQQGTYVRGDSCNWSFSSVLSWQVF